ncbi:MAG: protein kinase [Saprospiraceae bacterium]|nr:protein kinase [Saprospiraceae bacterium]
MARIIKPPYFESVVNDGEKRLLDFLQVNLPDSYILIPNIELAATNTRNNRTQYWEYDLVVVAPHAIFNIENKDWKGRIEGDDSYWYLNDRQRPNPLKTCRLKSSILAAKLKEHEYLWGKAWVQSMVTLSYHNIMPPYLMQEAGKITFQLDEKLIRFLSDASLLEKREDDIADIQKEIANFLIGNQSKKSNKEKKEVAGFDVLEILQQEPNYTEYLVKLKGLNTAVKKRVKEYALQVSGLSAEELKQRESRIRNQYVALASMKAKPFILNVEFRIDEENHMFYEISDFLDENSLRSEAKHKTFTFQEKLNIIRNIMTALKEAHHVNIFHRDINPDNVFLHGGYAYLGNFGKSYFADDDRQGYTVMATINEMNATAYHPLELTVGDASRASDIYSLGVLVYWLFTDREPFKTPYDLDKMGGQLTPDKLPSAINASLPKWLDELCNKTILIDDLKRIDSIDELEQFIESALKEAESNHTNKKEVPKQSLPSKDTYDLKEGDRIGDYTIYKILGKGGYSRVFKVKHTLQGQEYTLKLFHESVNVASVKDEYNSLIQLEHPNIVKFVWNGTVDTGQFYTLTEYLEGENLSMYTRTDARLPVKRVFQVAKNILDALVVMQEQDKPILHRDIKPQNIIWDKELRFVLIDFNVASFAEDNKDFVGTNPYLAPDLIKEGYKVHWDLSADTFALGITLYELICKQHPWAPGKMPLVSKKPNEIKEIEPRISKAFGDFVMKAIQTNGQERFSSAQEMLDALKAIGEEGILEDIHGKSGTTDDGYHDQDYIKYINSLFSQSRHGNAGTRSSAEFNKYENRTYTPTKLDQQLIPAVLDGQYKLLIVTGNAGDGKTAFMRKIEENDFITDLVRYKHKNGARFKINGTTFESNYDGSQDEDEKANNEVLESFFAPFEHLDNYTQASEGRVIAINEGRLVEFLSTSSKYTQLANTIETYFYKEGHHELPDGLMIINLNLRSVVAKNNENASLFRQQIKTLTDKSLWSKCSGCQQAGHCFIKYNVESFNDTSGGDEVITRMEWLLRTAILKRERHITIRDLRSMISFMLTRDYTCDDIERLYENSKENLEQYWENYYFNITDAEVVDGGSSDRLIPLLRETDIGEVAIPDQDRELFFGRHDLKDYLEFSERTKNLIDTFNENKIWVPAHEQTGPTIKRIKTIQKNFIRHQYFEGKATLLNVFTDDGQDHEGNTFLMPSYMRRLPYHSVFKFVQVLSKGDLENKIKTSISRAISINEGCDHPAIDQKYLVLSSTEVKDPFSNSFRLFALDDFELFVSRTDHLVRYLEYEPDSLIFRHKEQNHIKLTISLDLYEMLYFIQQGFSPSLNDLRGKFIEMIIFKNMLENLNYHEVVLSSKDNLKFYSINRNERNQLIIQTMEF